MVLTLDSLTNRLHHSLLVTNLLLIRQDQARANPEMPQFVVDVGVGEPPLSIPADQLFTQNPLFLHRLQLDMPCYVIADRRPPTTLHFYAPNLWQRLFRTCHLYRLNIRIRPGHARVRFLAEHPDSRTKRAAGGGQIQLSSEQALLLLGLPKTVAGGISWPRLFDLLRQSLRRRR